ncbi:ribose 5-phosphate isomerase B [Pseudomonadota bacterium]
MDTEKLTIYLGSDHAGYDFKALVKEYIDSKGIKTLDLGAFSTESVDYPDIAREIGEKVTEEPGSLGILICGSGIGMSMAANKRKGIRAANCVNEYQSRMSRIHNHANVLCLGARVVGIDLAKGIIDAFLDAEESEEERHVRRVQKIEPNGDVK